VYYLVRFKVRQPADVEDVADREDVYVAPEGDRGWTVLEVEDEEDLRRTVEGQEVEEFNPCHWPGSTWPSAGPEGSLRSPRQAS
jgi:hypothetical protein